ncbi:MAG: hypothetical protein KatS3mg105_1807 [Gemmatales bacterium]|nr:MAG: hypothetical protein KatS3mg105_1807 [Gemmatales bacterium]
MAERDWICCTTNRTRWLVRPDLRDLLLGADGLLLDDWLRTGRADRVKHGPHRTVYRVRLPQIEFFVKQNRLVDVRSRLRQLVRPAKSRIEFEKALEISRRGIPTICPIALGEPVTCLDRADSFLLTENLAGALPLSDLIEKILPGYSYRRQVRIRHQLSHDLARFLCRMHDAGVAHFDLHAGNLLVRLSADDVPELFLIDLHAVQVGSPLTWRQRRENLVLLNRWFALRVSRSDRLRFWRAYDRQDTGRNERALLVEKATLASNLDFWRQRDRRCCATNRYYRRVRAAGICGFAVRDLDTAVVKEIVRDPDALFDRPDCRFLKDSPTSTVAEVTLRCGDGWKRFIYKRFRVKKWLDVYKRSLGHSPALRSWIFGHGLRERRLPTPRPWLVLERRCFAFRGTGYLLTEKLEQTLDLRTFLDAASTTVRRELVERIARLVWELHRRRLSQRDLKAANILVKAQVNGEASDIWFIDLVGFRRHRKLRRRCRIQNLARLNASFHNSAKLNRTDRLRFLRTYLQWGLRGKTGWKRWWRQIEQATQKKIDRNLRNRRPLA